MLLTELLSPWIDISVMACEISGLEQDSRLVKPGDLFLAFPGHLADGRLFIEQAILSGAVAVVYEPTGWPDSLPMPVSCPCYPMPSLLKKVAALASRFYQYPSRALSVTGVTGTNGKTTIAYQLAQAHDLLGSRAAYIGTLGAGSIDSLHHLDNTTPNGLCLQRLLSEYREVGMRQICMEVSSHALDQGRVTDIAFEQAIYTNLSHDHLDYHRTMQAYGDAKALLFRCETLRFAVINQDDADGLQMQQACVKSCDVVYYGLHDHSDVRASDCQVTLAGTTYTVHSPWGEGIITIQALGLFNIYNSLAVFTSLCASGYAFSAVCRVMGLLRASPGRMEVVSSRPHVIVDYAHTPDALENVLTTLLRLRNATPESPSGRLWVIFGCGGDRDKQKRPMMGQIASRYADVIILTSDNPRTENPSTILADIAVGITSHQHVLQIIDRAEAIHHALNHAKPKDTVLIAGKGHESYQQIGDVRIPFSDKAIVQSYASS